MQKHYLLLRNNQQTGPFTIDELLQQHLTSSDLVWVEDQSTAWLFPYEIEELRFAAAGVAAAKRGQRHIYVSYPAKPIPWMERTGHAQKQEPPITSSNVNPSNSDLERKAEELRQRALSWKPAEYYHPAVDEIEDHGNYSNPERPIHFEFHRRKRYVTLEHLMVVGLISVMAVAAWYRGWTPLRNRMSTTEETVTPMVSVDNHTAKKSGRTTHPQAPSQNSEQPLATLPLADTTTRDSMVTNDLPKKEVAKKKKPAKISIPIIIKPDMAQIPKEEPVLPPDPAVNSDKSLAASGVKSNTDDAAEKKKERKGFLGGLFKKKKKNPNAEQENSE